MRFIAEISGNHGGKLEHALELIHEVKRLGAEPKFQCFHPELLAKKREAGHLGATYTYEALRKIYMQTYTRSSWWSTIKREIGDYPWSCSVFSEADLEFMEYFRCPSYKIASFEFRDLSLIKAVASKGKPVVLSVNDSHTQANILNAWDVCRPSRHVTFLYATPYDKFELGDAIGGVINLSDTAPPSAHIGLSDHSPPGNHELAKVCAEAWVINMIERHICLPDVKTLDSDFSDTPEQFKALMETVEAITEPARNETTPCSS
jgi:pseudaminic acid synthase